MIYWALIYHFIVSIADSKEFIASKKCFFFILFMTFMLLLFNRNDLKSLSTAFNMDSWWIDWLFVWCIFVGAFIKVPFKALFKFKWNISCNYEAVHFSFRLCDYFFLRIHSKKYKNSISWVVELIPILINIFITCQFMQYFVWITPTIERCVTVVKMVHWTNCQYVQTVE